jgi:DNA-binding CsgD family transcriptional regulator
VIHRVQKSALPFRWHDLYTTAKISKAQNTILHEAQDAGLHCGIGIPLYGPRGELAGVGLASSLTDATPDRDTLCKLKALTDQLHLVYCALSAQENAYLEICGRLTPREVEILQWTASGKKNGEIASILHCKVNTVKWHKKQISEKLQANGMVYAFAKAVRLGYFNLDEIQLLASPHPKGWVHASVK